MQPIYYVTKDYEKAIGLEKLLSNLTIITPKQRFINKSLLNLKEFDLPENKSSTYRILQNSDVINFIKSDSVQSFVQVFKTSPQIERISNANNLKLLNSSAELNLLFEKKLSQYEELSKVGVPFPRTKVTTLESINFTDIEREFNTPFVIQFNSSHTGKGTLFIHTEEELKELQLKYPKRVVRLSKFIKGEAYTINCVNYNSETYVGGLSKQLTGLKNFTSNKGSTVGNDWDIESELSETLQNHVLNISSKVGKVMKAKGFRGMFGIDFIIKDNEVFVIEVNARQPASIPMHTKLQLMLDQIPLLILHLYEFLDIKIDLNPDEYNRNNLFAGEAFQIFVRAENDIRLPDDFEYKTGIYRLKDARLVYVRDAVSIEDLNEREILVRANPTSGIIKKDEELVRFQGLGKFENAHPELEKVALEIRKRIENKD